MTTMVYHQPSLFFCHPINFIIILYSLATAKVFSRHNFTYDYNNNKNKNNNNSHNTPYVSLCFAYNSSQIDNLIQSPQSLINIHNHRDYGLLLLLLHLLLFFFSNGTFSYDRRIIFLFFIHLYYTILLLRSFTTFFYAHIIIDVVVVVFFQVSCCLFLNCFYCLCFKNKG